MADLPNAAVKRLMVKNGAERISASAIGMAVAAAEDYLAKIAKAAAANAVAEKRKTIMDADIDAAKKTICSGASDAPSTGCCS